MADDLEKVKENGRALQYVDEQTEEICLAAVQQHGWALQFVKEQTEEICLVAVQQAGTALKYVEKQTEEMCLTAVQQNGYALVFVEEQTPEICLAAVQQYGEALGAVKEQTEEMCLAAVQEDGIALRFVNEQTEEMCLAAVQQSGKALEYVQKQTEEMCLAAVQQNGEALQFVKEQTPEIANAAAEQVEKATLARDREKQLQQWGFDSEEELEKFVASENEQAEEERLHELEQSAKQTLQFYKEWKLENEILELFDEQEQTIIENRIMNGFDDDFHEYVDSALEVPIPQFYTEFMEWNKENPNEWLDEVTKLEQYILDGHAGNNILHDERDQLLLFGKFMAVKGNDEEIIEKMKKFDELYEIKKPYMPLKSEYYASLSNAIQEKYYEQLKQPHTIEKRKPQYQQNVEKMLESAKKLYSNISTRFSKTLQQPNEIEKSIPSTTQVEKRKSYYQQNVDKLAESVKDGTAPFLVPTAGLSENEKITIQPPPLIRSAQTGKAYQGINQIFAQIALKEMGSKDNLVLTHEQAKINDTYIKRGSKSFAIISFNISAEEGKTSKVYHLFPVSSTKNPEKWEAMQNKTAPLRYNRYTISCESNGFPANDHPFRFMLISSPHNYISNYLAASSSGAKFETDVRTINDFKRQFSGFVKEMSHKELYAYIQRSAKNIFAMKRLYKNSLRHS